MTRHLNAVPDPAPAPDYSSRDVAIKEIKRALKERSGKPWSVRGGRGTAYGWITVTAPPSRSPGYGELGDEDRKELAALMGLDDVHHQGLSIAASSAYRREYVARAQGREPEEIAQPYWD